MSESGRLIQRPDDAVADRPPDGQLQRLAKRAVSGISQRDADVDRDAAFGRRGQAA
jgi:hypothetical protein